MTSYAPDEAASVIYSEKTWLQGAFLGNLVYGVVLTLFIMCFATLIQQMNPSNRKRQLYLIAFITLVFILGTLFMISSVNFTQLAFIENRNYPGGPSAYEQNMFWIPIDELGNVAFVLGNWSMDLLLVWRCAIIYSVSKSKLMLAVLLLPCLLFLASFVMGILFLVQTSASSPFGAVDFTLAYFCLTLGLNVVGTILIVIRILIYRSRMKKTLGPSHVTQYTNIIAILTESAALFSLFLIMFIVPFGFNNPLSEVFLQTLLQVQAVSSLLIVLRVATGKGWSSETTTLISTGQSLPVQLRNLTSMRFNSDAVSNVEEQIIEGKMEVSVSKDILRN